MQEHPLRTSTEACDLPADWKVIGDRIVEAAEQACVLHLLIGVCDPVASVDPEAF